MTIASPYLRAELARFSRAFKLTPREHDVLFLLVSGYGTVPEIASHLSLSGNTVHNHFKNIFRRTRTNTKPALLSLFLQQTLERYAASALLARRPRVLLVDGNNAECERLCRGLQSYGFEASSEGLPERVAERVADERIDVVIADGTTKKSAGHTLERELLARFGRRPDVLLVRPQGEVDAGEHTTTLHGPLQVDHVCFAVLERLAESSYERSRLFRVEAELTVRLEDGQQTRTDNVGFGGAFLALDRRGSASLGTAPRYPVVGSRIGVSLMLDDQRSIKTQSEVRWRRVSGRPGEIEGIGVRFIDLPDEPRRTLEDFVRRRKLEALERLATLATAVRRA